MHYTYDPVGNITQIRDDAQQTHYFNNAVVKPESQYEYDAVYQLIRATGREHAGLINDAIRTHSDIDFVPQLPHPNNTTAVRTYTEEYEYDLLGNIKKLHHRFRPQARGGSEWTRHYRYAYEDDPANRTNRLIATSLPGDPDDGPYSATYDYDAYGNMTKMPHLAKLDWNYMDQPRQVDLGGGGTAYYVYDLGGQRIRKVIERQGSTRTERIYLGAVEIYREWQNNDVPHLERYTLHISDNTGRIAQVDTKTKDDNKSDPANPLDAPLIRYQYSNHLGSAVLETDKDGKITSYEEYHPYGTTAYRSAKPGFDLSLKRYRFSGKELDDETGLYYFGARYYAAWLGRWTSSDPAGFVDGANLYRYCKNSPTVHRDPTGLNPKYLPGAPEDRLWPESTPAEREEFAKRRGFRIIDPNPKNNRWVGTPESGYWELGPEARLERIIPEGRGGEQASPTPADEESATPEPEPPISPSPETPTGSPQASGDAEGKSRGRSFFTSGFFKGLVVGLAVTVAVVAVVATGGAALAAILPAASAVIASSGVGTVIAAAGVTAAGINIVRSFRREDFWGNRIPEEEANFNLGLGVGSLFGAAGTKPISRVCSAIGQRAGQAVVRAGQAMVQAVDDMASGILVPAFAGGVPSGGAATATAPAAVAVSTRPATAIAGMGMGASVLKMSTKGKTFRGGRKRGRDNWYGYDRDKGFVSWWHRQGKREFGGEDIENAQEAKSIYDYWVQIGRPVPK